MLDVTPAIDEASIVRRRPTPRRRTGEYKVYYVIVFTAALPIVLAGRLFPRRLAEAGGAESAPRSLLAEARALTDTVIPYLFMG